MKTGYRFLILIFCTALLSQFMLMAQEETEITLPNDLIVFRATCEDMTTHLFAIEPDGSDLRQLTPSEVQSPEFPSWLGDSRVGYLTNDPMGFSFFLHSLDLESGESRVSQMMGDNPLRSLHWSADNAFLAYVAYGPEGQPEYLVVNDASLDYMPMTWVDMTSWASIAWSPTASELAYVGTDEQLHILSFPDQLDNVVTQHEGTVPSITWSPDGEQLAYVLRNESSSTIELVSLGAESASSISDFEFSAETVVWSPSGEHLAVIGYDQEGFPDIFVYHLTTKTWNRLTENFDLEEEIVWSPDGQYLVFNAFTGQAYNAFIASVQGSETAVLAEAGMIDQMIWIPGETSGNTIIALPDETSRVICN